MYHFYSTKVLKHIKPHSTGHRVSKELDHNLKSELPIFDTEMVLLVFGKARNLNYMAQIKLTMLSLPSIFHTGRSKTILFDKIKQVVADVEETSTPGFVELNLYHQPILANALSQYVTRYNYI